MPKILSSLQKLPYSLWRLWAVRFSAVVLSAILIFALGLEVGSGQVRIALFSPTQSKNGNLPTQLDYSSVNQVYQSLKENYDGKLTANQLLDGLKEGLAESTNDPYTEYFNANAAKDFSNQLNNSFSGIGAALGKDSDGNLIVIAPLKGFPAAKVGLKAQDIIVDINGESTAGLSPDAAVNKIRGPKGTQVTLKIVRDKAKTLSFTITRDDIQLPSVTSRIIDGTIGYLEISSFSDDTVDLAQKAAQNFASKHVTGVIMDLRGNPGGLLDAAVGVSSLWLPEGATVVSEKGTSGDQTYTATGNDILHGIPTVLLIDDGSASASEITAGALHDNHAARLIGTKSYGKGVVQQLVQFNDGSELKVTIASWYRPNGQNINKKGITPDQQVTNSAKTDSQLAAAEAYLNK